MKNLHLSWFRRRDLEDEMELGYRPTELKPDIISQAKERAKTFLIKTKRKGER